MDQPLDYANRFLTTRYGIDCATLLAPVDVGQPQGVSLRGTPIWNAIRRARESDDASLPLGAWVRQLRRASWGEVARASLDALAYRSKDLQLATWLTEALLQEYGFPGLAAGLAIADALCERYWDVMYPPGADGDFEHRANLVRWLNEKLVMPVRLVPLTAPVTGAAAAQADQPNSGQPPSETSHRYSWADCEQLRRQQQSSQTAGSRNEVVEGIDAADFAKALEATSNDALLAHHAALTQTLAALAKLGATLDQCFDNDAPGLGTLRGLIEQIHVFITAQLVQRGLPATEPARPPEPPANNAGVVPLTETISVEVTMAPPRTDAAGPADADGNASSPVDARKRAYAQLAEAAAALAEIEPHSPVPYLVRKAVEWGKLNTAQLYDELFIQGRGQLNVFELLGLGTPQGEEGEP